MILECCFHPWSLKIVLVCSKVREGGLNPAFILKELSFMKHLCNNTDDWEFKLGFFNQVGPTTLDLINIFN